MGPAALSRTEPCGRDRRLTWIAVLGAVVGGFVLGNVVGILAMLVLAALVWLVADGVRDLSPSRREHPRLDVVRFISVAVLVIFAIGVALWMTRHPGDESGEAIIFAMMAGVGAAMIVTGAEAATSLAAQRTVGTGVPGT